MGGEGKGGEGKGREGREGRLKEGRRGEGDVAPPPFLKFLDPPLKYAYRDSWGWEQPQQQCRNIGLGSGKTTKDGLKDGLHKL